MQHRILWVHGIGPHQTGWSAGWRDNLNQYLHLMQDNYLEVCWDSVFHAPAATRGEAGPDAIELTPQEALDEEQVRLDLETILLARTSALEQSQAPATTRGDDEVVEWSELQQEAITRGALDWLFKPDEYIGDFAKYLVSRNVRNAVKEKAKEQLRPLAGTDVRISIIAHSWGTVVSYDSLLDLQAELPGLQIGSLLTFGSPLWMVRRWLEDRTGRKPAQVGAWVNIHARGDVVGSWLSRGFKVDKEFQVPRFGNVGAHSSYFESGNTAVLQDLVGRYVLQPS